MGSTNNLSGMVYPDAQAPRVGGDNESGSCDGGIG
jgi:hypothetical protein